MSQDTQIVLPFARLCGKNLQADFDGGTLSSDGGVLFFREIEAQIGIIRRFAGVLDDPRDPRYTDHSYEEMLSQRIFQMACGYDDANDCNSLRHDPAFKAAAIGLVLTDAELPAQRRRSVLLRLWRRREHVEMDAVADQADPVGRYLPELGGEGEQPLRGDDQPGDPRQNGAAGEHPPPLEGEGLVRVEAVFVVEHPPEAEAPSGEKRVALGVDTPGRVAPSRPTTRATPT